MIPTRILKVDLEIALIFEVKVATRHLEIDILLLQWGKKIVTGDNFDFKYLSYFYRSEPSTRGPQMCTENRRQEVFSVCLHRHKEYLKNAWEQEEIEAEEVELLSPQKEYLIKIVKDN